MNQNRHEFEFSEKYRTVLHEGIFNHLAETIDQPVYSSENSEEYIYLLNCANDSTGLVMGSLSSYVVAKIIKSHAF
jgi:hypothetical protein